MKAKSILTVLINTTIAFILIATILLTPGSAAAGVTASYIVQGNNVDQVAYLVNSVGGKVTSRLDIINGVGAMLSYTAAARLANDAGIIAITPNGQMQIDSKTQAKNNCTDD